SVYHPDAERFEMSQQVQRVKDSASRPPVISRRTHSIKEETVLALALRRIVLMSPRVHADIVEASTIEFGKQRTKPVGGRVVNRDRQASLTHLFLSAKTKTFIDAIKAKRPLGLSGLCN